METASLATLRIRFDEFEVDLRTQELRRDGRALRLPQQSFIVLSMLLERPGELVTREALRQRLWPTERFVDTEQSLNAAVNRLREALRDSANDPKYIETLPRRGYRFIGAVEPPQQLQTEAVATTSTMSPADISTARGPSRLGRPVWLSVVLVAVALLAIGSLWIVRGGRDSDEQGAGLVPFTSLPKQELAPAFSPDGRHIVFAWNGESENGFDLYVKQRDTEKTLRLTSQPAQWLSAAWSPDGTSIAFARASGTGGGIYVLPAPLGGDERRLASASFPLSPLTQVSWSPDGERLVYPAFSPEGSLALYEVDVQSPTPRALDIDVDCWDVGSPTFSPDGKRIAFACMSSFAVYSIHVMGARGGSSRRLTRLIGSPKGLTWSRDGEHLIFSNDTGDGGGLWEISLDGKVARIPFGEQAWTPHVDASGARIAYARVRERIDIWRVDLKSSAPDRDAKRLISSTRIQMNPQYSPDGSRIAFQSTRSGSSEIWVANSDGSNPVRISSFNGPLAGAPTWCRDGRRIAFDSRASGISAIYVADIDERQPKKVETSVANLALPVWSADCEWLLASDGHAALYILPSQGGEAKRFTMQRSYYAGVAGDHVIFNVKGPSGVSFWRKRIGSGEEEPLDGMPELIYDDSWFVAPDGIYFTLANPDPRIVRFFDFAARTVSEVAQLARAPAAAGGLGLSVSSDGRWLLYTQTEEQEGDIMILTQE